MSAQSTARLLKEGLLLRMHPLQRISLSLICSVVAYFFLASKHIDSRMMAMSLWDVFAFTFIVTSWMVILKRTPQSIRRQARKQDGSRVFVLTFIIAAVAASLITILQLIISTDLGAKSHIIHVLIAIGGMLLSWAIVHTVFTFHYAHIYYDNGKDPEQDDAGLEFPGERQPDYLEFAYFAFVIGMTFQVSDVTTNSKRMRRVVLIHGLVSFLLNTFVVALAINFIAGLRSN